MSTKKESYLILGAGVFGISTAYHLQQSHPDAEITILDRDAYDAPSRVAASWDWNKVVRADYDDKIYCALALEAQDIFRSHPLWKPFYHETGIYWLCRSDYAREVLRNYADLGRKADLAAVSPEEAKGLFGGVFGDADSRDVKEVLVNRTSGWAAAGDCLVAVTREVLRRGARFVVSEAVGLKIEGGRCVGVETKNAGSWMADHVVLCTGAYTATLLELSAKRTGIEALRAEGRIVAGGITTGMTKLDRDDPEFGKYASMPVGVQGFTPETGPFVGSLPPTKDGELKWWGQTIFRNTRPVGPGGSRVSMPPPAPDYAQWEVSERLREDIVNARDMFYGEKSKGWKMEKHRICWDAFTTSSDFIISPHSAAEGLYIATCGNFHGWKFFPVLGKYIVQMLDGTLEPELVERWAWDRERPDPAAFADWPRVEMRELVETEREARL